MSRIGPRSTAKPGSDQIGEFFGRVRDPPAIEIAGLLIEPRQNAREEFRIVRVAVSRRVGTYPFLRTVRAGLRRTVVDRFKIGNIFIFPGGRIALGYSAAGLGKPRVADGAVVTEKLAGGRANRFGCSRRERFRDALIALAVVVGAYVEIRMRFAAIPAKDFVRIESPRSALFRSARDWLSETTASCAKSPRELSAVRADRTRSSRMKSRS